MTLLPRDAILFPNLGGPSHTGMMGVERRMGEVPSEPFSSRYFVPCGTGREKAGAGPRPSNPLLPGSQLLAKNSTFGEWQSWGRFSSPQAASEQHGQR